MTQSKGLQKLGVSENDVKIAERLLNQIPPCPSDTENKAEQVLGFACSRLYREKAIRILGTSETEIELENAKNLGSLGVGGRRRSWQASDLTLSQSEYCPYPPHILRRRHTFSSKRRIIEVRSFGQCLQSQLNVNV
ncbi:hypothetical protein ACHAXM_011036 [Skeletonema potamos]|jgi:hypothetical protein